MRTSSLVKVLAGWFLAPVAVGSVAFYVVRPLVSSPTAVESEATGDSEAATTGPKRYTAPKVTVNSHRATIKRGGGTVGRRPKRKVTKPKVEEAGVTNPDAPTSMGPDIGGTPPATTSAPDTGSTGTGTGTGTGIEGG